MAIGATTGVTYAVERMSMSKGGKGGRIITTASYAGLVVRIKLTHTRYRFSCTTVGKYFRSIPLEALNMEGTQSPNLEM